MKTEAKLVDLPAVLFLGGVVSEIPLGELFERDKSWRFRARHTEPDILDSIENATMSAFKTSYHETGKSQLRVPTRGGRSINVPSVPLAKLKGKKRVGASSGDQKMLEWGYKPKPDSLTRRTKILDAEELKVPSWTAELWALGPGRPALVEEAAKFYSPGCHVIDHLLADWPSPNLLIVIWTLKYEGWAALERSVKAGN